VSETLAVELKLEGNCPKRYRRKGCSPFKVPKQSYGLLGLLGLLSASAFAIFSQWQQRQRHAAASTLGSIPKSSFDHYFMKQYMKQSNNKDYNYNANVLHENVDL
jgi:hypothetical protein